MSRPSTLDLPECARAERIATARGVFAAQRAEPPAGVAVRGTALLVPGFTGSKEDFTALLAPLAADGWRVAAIDQRGQYETAGADDDAGYALDALAADLAAVAAAVRDGGGGPVHLLGHSFGGLVAREAVLRAAGEDVSGSAAGGTGPWRSLTLMSSGPAAVDAGDAARLSMLLDALGTVDLETIWQAMRTMDAAPGVPDGPPVTPPAPVEGASGVAREQAPAPPGRAREPRGEDPRVEAFLHRRWLANDPRCLAMTARHLLAAADRVPELAAVGLPVLVVSGEQDDAWPVAWQAEMAERLGVPHRIVPGAGHSPNTQRPAGTARVLAEFWRSVD